MAAKTKKRRTPKATRAKKAPVEPDNKSAKSPVTKTVKGETANGETLNGGSKPGSDQLLNALLWTADFLDVSVPKSRVLADLPLKEGRLGMDAFERAADNAGLVSKFTKMSLRKVVAEGPPMVLALFRNKSARRNKVIDRLEDALADADYTDFELWMVRKIEGNKVHLVPADDPKEERTASLSELKTLFTGYVISLEPKPQFSEAARELKSTLGNHWFWGRLLEQRWIFGQVLAASFLINIFALAFAIFIMAVYDRVLPNNAVETLWTLALGMGVVLLFDLLLKFLRTHFIETVGRRADVKISSHIYGRMLDMQLSARRVSTGALASTMKEFDTVRDFFTAASLAAIVDLPFTLLFLLVIASLSGLLALVLVVAVVAIIVVAFLAQKPLKAAVERASAEAREKHGLLVESIKGIETIKATGSQSKLRERWEDLVVETSKSNTVSRLWSSEVQNFMGFLQYLALVSLVIVGVYQVWVHELTMGALIAAVILTSRAIAPLMRVASMLVRLQQFRDALKNLDDLMALPVERPEDRNFLHREKFEGGFEFKNVKFKYPGQETELFQNLSFKIEPGERICLLGRIGSGKTAILRLMDKLYTPDDGSILVDGTDIRQIDPLDLRQNIGVVPQDPVLFGGSLRDNIALAETRASDEAILEAARLAGVDDFASRHPHGYDMQISEGGANLSGGQRQAVMIARAILKKPKILLLDEPTSSMDQAAEADLIERMQTFLKGRTVVLATHKSTLIKLADRVMYVRDGKIIADSPAETFLENFTRQQKAAQ